MRLPFADRDEAGRDLAADLAPLALDDPVILGVPRGGVAVASPVAQLLQAPLDVIVVRKIGAPQNAELGLGAIGEDGPPVLDERLIDRLGVTPEYLERATGAERDEVRRRVAAYRGDTPAPAIEGRDAVVVDDGIATGGTVIAAARVLRGRRPKRLVLAVPVAPMEGVARAREVFDEVVCPNTPSPFLAVGEWYRDFHQVTDDEVRAVIAADG